MADQVELTGSAVIERLKMDLVPKRVNADDTVEYYLWAITDQQLHKYLSDAFYGQFVDSTDDLYSVTMPPQRRKNLWIFAPSMDLIDWFIDAAGDHNNEQADVDGNLKLAYVKMSSVEERLDEGEYPVVHQLTHKDTNKLYAYDIKHLSIINQLMIAQLEDNVSEEELLASMDDRDKTLHEQESSYTSSSSSQVSDIEPVDTDKLSEEDEGLNDIFSPEFEDDGAEFIDEDMAQNISVSDDESSMDDDENTLDLDEDTMLFDSESDSDLSATNKSEDAMSTETIPKTLPKTLEHMLKQIDVPLLKSPTVHAESAGLDDYTQQVDEVRSQLNDQLRSLAESSKQKIISSYYEKHSITESKIDARLDPENGDANVVDAYRQVQASNRQDLDDVSSLEKQKRQELLGQMDEFHSQYMKEVIAQAEKDWQSIKDTRYVEEPIQAWRKGISATVDSQNDERLRRFNDWRSRIKSQYLTQVDAPILESLSKDVQNIVEQLQLEQVSARQELSRSEDRLFNKSLELEKINLQRSAPASKSGPSNIMPVDDDSDEELYDEDNSNEDVLAVDDPIDEIDDDLEIDEEPIDNGDDEDDWDMGEDDDDLSLSDDSDSDVLSLDENDNDDLQLDELNDDDDNMVNDVDYGDDLADEFPDLEDDTDEPIAEEKPSSIDEFVENSSDDVDEQSVIEHTLDDIDDIDLEEEDDDDVASVAPDSGKPVKSKKKSKLPSKQAKKNKPKNASSSKMSKKMMMIIGGIATLVIIGLFVGSVMLFGGNSNGLKVSPSATNTYVKGNMLSAKQDGKNVALVIKSVDGNKLTVTDVSNNKTYTINKPSSK